MSGPISPDSVNVVQELLGASRGLCWPPGPGFGSFGAIVVPRGLVFGLLGPFVFGLLGIVLAVVVFLTGVFSYM